MMKQQEVQRIQEEVNLKDEETKKLQEEVAEARRRQEEAAAALLDATTPQHHHVHEDDHEENDDMVNGEFGKHCVHIFIVITSRHFFILSCINSLKVHYLKVNCSILYLFKCNISKSILIFIVSSLYFNASSILIKEG